MPSVSVPAATFVAVTPAPALLIAVTASSSDPEAGVTVVFFPSAPTSVSGSAADAQVDIAAVTPTCAAAVDPTWKLTEPAEAVASVATVTPVDELFAAYTSSDVALAASPAFVASVCTSELIVCSDDTNELVSVSLFLSRVCGTCSMVISELIRSEVLRPLTRPSIARLLPETDDVDIAGLPVVGGGRGCGDAAVRRTRTPPDDGVGGASGGARARPGCSGSPARASRCRPGSGCCRGCT